MINLNSQLAPRITYRNLDETRCVVDIGALEIRLLVTRVVSWHNSPFFIIHHVLHRTIKAFAIKNSTLAT